jgi:diaminopimelate epimerase
MALSWDAAMGECAGDEPLRKAAARVDEELQRQGMALRIFCQASQGALAVQVDVVDGLRASKVVRGPLAEGEAVDMGAPVFDLARVPFNTDGLSPLPEGTWQVWPLPLEENQALAQVNTAQAAMVNVAVLSMGNPHAVQIVDDAERAPVAQQGPLIESHPAFPERVNAGFMQIVNRGQIRLRVYERAAGETLACGTGACAAVVAGIRLGLLDARVDVHTHGGVLTIEWAGGNADPVRMTGPAVTVFEGETEVPDLK